MSGDRTRFFVGALAGAVVMSVLFTAASVFADRESPGQAASRAADAGTKYASKVVLENDRVRVKDVTFPPGVMDTGMHTHQQPHVGVILTDGALVFTEPRQRPQTVQFSAGSVGYREANVTHQVSNPGKAPMRVIEVELK